MKTIFAVLLTVFCFNVSALASETLKGAEKDLETFKATMSEKLKELDKKIDALKAQASEKSDDVSKKSVENYEATRTKLREDLAHLQDGAKRDWKVAKGKIAKALDELNAKIQKSLKTEDAKP